VNAARLTSGKGSLSWPTATAFDFNNTPLNRIDGTGKTYKSNLKEAVHQNWPTVCASEVRQGFQDRSRGMKGSQESLTTAVIKQWPTPNCMDVITPTRDLTQMESKGHWGKGMNTGKLSEMVNYGQAAPASSSSLGSRQGLWLTPRANEPDSDPNFAARNADRGAHCHGTLSSQAKAEQWPTPEASQGGRQGGSFSQQSWKNADGLPRQMSLAQATKMWPTITAHTPDMESNGPNGHQGTYLAGAVKQWMTPRACEAQNPPMGVDKRHHGLTHQVTKQWATPRSAMASMHPEYGEHWNDNRGGESIATQVWREEQWGTPTARDHKSGRGNEDRQYKELTPMVERAQAGKLNQNWVCCLMGVPMGWVDPLCPVSVIKNWPRFVTGWARPQTAQIPCDSSATELCLPPQSEPSEFSLAS
jgi:hypothetical protein